MTQKLKITKVQMPHIALYPFNDLADDPFYITQNRGDFVIEYEVRHSTPPTDLPRPRDNLGEPVPPPKITQHQLIITVPAYTGTDGASCPRWTTIQPVRFMLPALLHDYGYRYELAEMTTDPDPRILPAAVLDDERRFFDLVLKASAKQCQCLPLAAPARIYAAVRLFGSNSFRNAKRREQIAGDQGLEKKALMRLLLADLPSIAQATTGADQ